MKGGGTMFCSKAMNSVTRPLFHDANSKRGGVLMHAKVSSSVLSVGLGSCEQVLIATFEPRPDNLGFGAGAGTATSTGKRKLEDVEGDVGGWAYVGSHNFSPSAWVRTRYPEGVNTDGFQGTVNLKKTPTLNIKNYEMGVVFPLREHIVRLNESISWV
jgi:tyrosyl-DNA phosphodiesterase-1